LAGTPHELDYSNELPCKDANLLVTHKQPGSRVNCQLNCAQAHATMIKFKFPEEKAFLTLYAEKMGDQKVITFIQFGRVESEQEAEHLSLFFWRMVDRSNEDQEQNAPRLFNESNEFWNEKIMYSISGYLQRAGFEHIWERVSDGQ
jgi:hypothetical protein